MLVLAALLVGCRRPLGSNDVVLVLESSTPIGAEDVVAVRWRLSLHHTHAEVTLDGPNRLRVLLDRSRADDAERTLTKPGGLAVARVTGEHPTAISEDPIIRMHWPHAHSDEKQVRISLTSAEITRLLKEPPDELIAVTWGKTIMWHGSLATSLHTIDGELETSAGPDIAAYARAREQAKLFNAPPLPTLSLTYREPQPIDWLLVVSVLGLPIAVAISWLFFVRRFDRARPEPWWLLLATVGLGAVAAPLAGLIEVAISKSSPYLDCDVLGLDHSVRALPLGLLAFTLLVGCIEEGMKLLAAWSFAMHRREFDEPIDGIVFAVAAAIGFATAENIMYFSVDRLSGGLFTLRSMTCVSGHFIYAAIWGYALGQRLVSRKARVLPYFALAALLHGAWDAAMTFAIPFAELVLMVILTVTFTVLVRRALRWGVVSKSPQSGVRTQFRLGRQRGFLVAIVAMFAFGWRLEVTALSAGHGTTRVDLELLAWLAAYGTLFIASVWAMTALIPLDVVLDDEGLTFAGALRTWSEIHGIKRVDDHGVVLASEHGDVHLRPGSKATIDQLEAAVTKRLAQP